MPQVWLSYSELGEHFDLATEAAREMVHVRGWDRRRCHDGLTRVKLPPDVALSYMVEFLNQTAISAALDLRTQTRTREGTAQRVSLIPNRTERAA